jgi:hypothetical protein
MITAVWKFRAPIQDTFEITMPRGAEVLTVQMQESFSDPQVWAKVDQGADPETRFFNWVGTGHEMPDVGRYIGTVQYGRLVFHLFEAAA